MADRTPTTQDLTIPDPPMAAGFLPRPAPTVVSPNGPAAAPGPATVPGPASLAPVVIGQWSVVSVRAPAADGPAGSPVGLEMTLVVQGTDPAERRGRMIRIDSEATDLSRKVVVPGDPPTEIEAPRGALILRGASLRADGPAKGIKPNSPTRDRTGRGCSDRKSSVSLVLDSVLMGFVTGEDPGAVALEVGSGIR